MKHVVILDIAEGDEITVTRIFDDSITAIGYAKTAAKECSKEFYKDFSNDWDNCTYVRPPDEPKPEYEPPVETFWVGNDGDYRFTVNADLIAHKWIVHPVE